MMLDNEIAAVFLRQELTLRLSYDPSVDPYAVAIGFPSGTRTWWLGRAFLAAGIRLKAVPRHQPGERFEIHSGGCWTHIAQCTPHRDPVELLFLRRQLCTFLNDTYRAVGAGSEDITTALDAALLDLLGRNPTA